MGKAKTGTQPVRAEGFDGAQVSVVPVRITATRTEHRIVRSRPGTFEWRYGRATADSALYHAGVRFAELWEKAGTASASSPDMKSSGGGQWKGLPDGRLDAMHRIEKARLDIGKWGTARLVDYCVMGTPSAEMATKYQTDERAMSHVLMMDLRAAAYHFRFL